MGRASVAGTQPIERESCLAVDETFVYWCLTDSIKRAPLAGGDAVTVLSGLTNPNVRMLAVDDTQIYWGDDVAICRVAKPAP